MVTVRYNELLMINVVNRIHRFLRNIEFLVMHLVVILRNSSITQLKMLADFKLLFFFG